MTFCAPMRLGGDDRDEGRVDAAGEADDAFREAALSRVVARAEDERREGLLLLCHLEAGQPGRGRLGRRCLGVEYRHVLFERLARRDDLALGRYAEAAAVEDKLVVAADLVYKRDRYAVLARAEREHLPPQRLLAETVGARGEVEDDLAAPSLDGVGHGVGHVAFLARPRGAAAPEVAVVPRVLANGDADALAVELEDSVVAPRRRNTAPRRIRRRWAGAAWSRRRLSRPRDMTAAALWRSRPSAQSLDAKPTTAAMPFMRLCEPLERLQLVADKGLLHQEVPRRVPDERQLRKQRHPRPRRRARDWQNPLSCRRFR